MPRRRLSRQQRGRAKHVQRCHERAFSVVYLRRPELREVDVEPDDRFLPTRGAHEQESDPVLGPMPS